MSQSQGTGTPGGSALGLPYNPEDENADQDFGAMFADEAPGDQVEAPTTEEADEPSTGVFGDQPDDDDEPAAEVAVEEPAAEDEAPAQQTVTFLGREQTVAQTEEQFRQIQRGFTDVVAWNKQHQAALDAMKAEQEQVRQFLLQQAAEADPEFAERIQREQEMSRLVDERVRQQVEPIVQPIQQREAVQQVVAQAQGAIQAFYQRNGLTQGDERDQRTLKVFEQLATNGYEVDLTKPEHLDYALAIADGRQAAPVGVVLEPVGAGPAPGGGATVPPASAAPNGAPAAPKAPVRRRVEAHVETGGSGAPASAAPGAPRDEFEEAFDYYQRQKARGPLFGSNRT